MAVVGGQMIAGGSIQLSTSGQHRVLVVLCVTQIVSWGVLYYAFPVLAPNIAADTGWSIAAVTAAFSAGLVVSALVGIPAGRWLDRFGPRPVMTAGSVLSVPAVLIIGTARSFPVFVAGWLLGGVAMAGTLYPPAFAALTRWWGRRRVTALTALTLLAGLASTVVAPLTATLLDHLGWQHSYLSDAHTSSRTQLSQDPASSNPGATFPGAGSPSCWAGAASSRSMPAACRSTTRQ